MGRWRLTGHKHCSVLQDTSVALRLSVAGGLPRLLGMRLMTSLLDDIGLGAITLSVADFEYRPAEATRDRATPAKLAIAAVIFN